MLHMTQLGHLYNSNLSNNTTNTNLSYQFKFKVNHPNNPIIVSTFQENPTLGELHYFPGYTLDMIRVTHVLVK